MLYSVNVGQSLAGPLTNWVSTLSISYIQSILDTTLLPALETVENAYKQIMSAT